MAAPEDSNPFEAPEADELVARVDGQPTRPWVLVVFLIRRALLIVVLPLLLGLIALAWRAAPFWVAVVATWMVFVPTTAAVLVDRFLAPVTDPSPVVLASGLRMDRDRFKRLIRVSAVERLALASMLVAFAVVVVTTPVGLLAPFLVLFAAWTTWFSVQHVRMGDAIVALVEEDPHTILQKLTPVARWPRLNRLLRDQALMGIAQAELMLGEPLAAIATLERVPPNGPLQAHFARAALLAGQDRTDEAKRALEGRVPTNLGERIAYARAEVGIALAEERYDDIVSGVARWKPLVEGVPAVGRLLLEQAYATALVRSGRASEGERWSRGNDGGREWIYRAWPRLWRSEQVG